MAMFNGLYETVSDLKWTPWRTPEAPITSEKWKWKEETFQKLFDKIAATTVPQDCLKDGKLNILVIGPKSHGKSSFINAVASLSAKDPLTVTNEGSGGESFTVTTVLRHFDLPGAFKCFRLCDVPGLQASDSADTLVVNLKLVIDGHIKSGYKFSDKEPISTSDETYYNSQPTLENKMHGVIIVLDIAQAYEIHIKHRQSIASITQKLYEMNIPISVVLTKVDTYLGDNIEKIYSSKSVLTAVKNTERWLGIPEKHIHPVVNFVENHRYGWQNGLPILVAIRACLSKATNHLPSIINDEKMKATKK